MRCPLLILLKLPPLAMSAVSYEQLTKYIIPVWYEHQTASKHYFSLADPTRALYQKCITQSWYNTSKSTLSEMETTLKSNTSKLQTRQEHEQWQVIKQTWDMQVSATGYLLHCTDGKIIICIWYKLEKQASDYSWQNKEQNILQFKASNTSTPLWNIPSA
jgi:hypothetical protein